MSTDTRETPTYDQLIRERVGAGDWTPDQLRPPLDLNEWLSDSYAKAMTRHHLLRQIEQRSKVKRARRPRRKPLP